MALLYSAWALTASRRGCGWEGVAEVVVVGVDEGEACSTMPNQPFSPGSRLSVWVRGAPCHRGLAHSSAQCPCQSWQHFLPLLAPALAGIHNISQLPTMACLPAPTIWLLWATILTHITNYSKSWERERTPKKESTSLFPVYFLCITDTLNLLIFCALTFVLFEYALNYLYITWTKSNISHIFNLKLA